MQPLDKYIIDYSLLRAVSEIDEFKGRWLALGRIAPERLTALRRIATIESVGSSTRIEGAKLSDAEVELLLAGLDVGSFKTRDEQEVAGYAELMELVFESYREIPLTENHIQQLHSVLLKHSSKFETASPFDTPRLMQELISWARAALDEGRHHPILVIAVFVVRFLAIHPFHDGNGRLSRALTTLLMMRAGYDYVPYSSLERIVEENKDSYYLALRRAQSTLDQDESCLGDWISFFTECLLKQKEVLQRKLDQQRLMEPLAPLSEKILAIARAHGRVTVREVVSLTKANRNTVKAHLQRLAKAGHLMQRGQGRGTWYEVRKS